MSKKANWKRQIWHRDKWLCRYCGCQVQGRDHYRTDAATVDHITPLARGGMSTQDNMVTACRGCNAGKGDMTLAEYERAGKPKRDYQRKGKIPSANYALERGFR